MSIWNWFKDSKTKPKTKPKERTVADREADMIGEPVKTFLQSLKDNPKRYQLQRVQKLSSKKYPGFTGYHWMKGAGYWELTDKKTGTTFGAYVHEEGGYSNPMRCTKHLYLYEGEEEAIYEYYKGVIRAAFAARGGAIC